MPNSRAADVYRGTPGRSSDASTAFDTDDPECADCYRSRFSGHEEFVRGFVARDLAAVDAAVARHNR